MKAKALDAYTPSARIAFREIEGQILLLLPADTEIYTFNAAGALIWRGLTRKRSLSRIIADLVREFDIERERAEADVMRFVRDMERRGVLAKKARR